MSFYGGSPSLSPMTKHNARCDSVPSTSPPHLLPNPSTRAGVCLNSLTTCALLILSPGPMSVAPTKNNLWVGTSHCYNITSAWAVDREFVNIDWASLGPNFTQLGSNLIQILSNSDHIGSHWPLLGQKWSFSILESKL